MHQVKVTAERTGWLVSCLEPKTRYPDRRYLPDIRTIPGKQDIRCKSGFPPEIRRRPDIGFSPQPAWFVPTNGRPGWAQPTNQSPATTVTS